jgi:hypothetical protein
MGRTKSLAPLKLTAEKQEPRQTKASAEHGLASKNQCRNNSVAEPRRAAGIKNERQNPNLGALKTK